MVIQSESSDPIMTYCCASSKNCCFLTIIDCKDHFRVSKTVE